MKNNLRTGSWVMLVMVLIMIGCRKDNAPEKLPDLNIIFKPVKGLTTDIFEIRVNPATEGKVDRTLFYRWDWNNDGNWDTPFSTGDQVKHRFLQPGTHVVRLEYADGKKQVRTENLMIAVEQGYSAPHPAFKISPGKGNILSVFTFDASLSTDDEDSLDQLKFRWDFRGDGHWTPDFSKNPIATNQYISAGVFNPKLEVRDPSGRTATFSGELTVTMEDSLIIAGFSVNDTMIRLGDTVLFDASASYYSTNPRHELLYSWYLPDRVEWTIPDAEKTRTVIISQQGPFTVGLKVVDKETKLFNQITKDFFAADKNYPPKARIRVGSVYGNILTQFCLDSWSSTDDSQIPSDLEVRWDFEGDGVWDTPFSKEKVIFHQFELPGSYYITLQVRDNQGLANSDGKRVIVSGNTNQTSYFRDQRDGTYYGTVKIGEQWWMSQNLNFTVPQKSVEGMLQWICLFEQSKWCEQVGKLYRIGAVVRSEADAEYIAICPGGWRLPSSSDWETLFSAIGGKQYAKELRYGGKYDFNAIDMGYADYTFIRDVYYGNIIDTIFQFHETYQMVRLFSSTDLRDPIRADNIWMWSVDRATGTAWTGFGLSDIYMPVRCVKDE